MTKKENARFLFPAESTAELTARLVAAGPGAKLRVLITEDDNAYLKVVASGEVQAAADVPDINNAHRCPPFTDCPE